MGIKKIADGKYEIRFSHDGEEVRRNFIGTRADANKILAKLKSDIAASRADGQIWDGVAKLRGKPRTFEQVTASYLTSLKTTKPNTIISYGSILKQHILPELGHLPIRSVNQACVETFHGSLYGKQTKNNRGTLKVRTINTIMAVVSAILNYAGRVDEIDKVPKVKAEKEPASDIDPLSHEELAAVMKAALPFWRPIFQLLASTGIREGELFALRWSDIDLQKNEIRITKQLSKNVEVAPKSASSIRTVTILPTAHASLLILRERNIASIAGHVMVSQHGKQLKPSQAYEAWVKTLKRADLKHRPLHQLRHTYASLLLDAGVKPGWVSKQLGHANMKITFDVYLKYIKSSDSGDALIASGVFNGLDKNTPIKTETVQ